MPDDSEQRPARPSKTQRKQEMHDLQRLGESLVALPREEVMRLELPDDLREAVLLAQRISARRGLRRQMQFIGALMRTVDATHIREVIAAREARHHQDGAEMRLLENWRKRLLDDDDALDDLAREHPAINIDHVRSLVEKSRREKERGGAPHGSRELFRVLREFITGH